MNKNILSIARFTAVIIVVLFHQKSRFEYLEYLPDILVAGSQVCTFFFVLSGFVLALSYSSRYVSFDQFMVRRLRIIYPVYLISLVLTLPVAWARGEFDIVNVIVNAMLLQSWVPSYPLTLNIPAWFLSTLLFFYLTFPVLINSNMTRKKNAYLLPCTILFWLITQFVLTYYFNSGFYAENQSLCHDLIFYFPLSHYCSFLLGVSGGIVFNKSAFKGLKGYQKNLFLVLIIVSIAFAIDNQLLLNSILGFRLPYGASLYAPAFLLLIYMMFLINDIRLNETLTRVVRIFGSLSLPVFLLHAPIASYFFYCSGKINTPAIIQLPFYFVVLLLVSYAVMRCVTYCIKDIS